MKRRTIVVEGPFAFRMRRIVATRRGEAGLQIMTLPQLAARIRAASAVMGPRSRHSNRA